MCILFLILFGQECVNKVISSLLMYLLATDIQTCSVWEIGIVLLETQIPVVFTYQMFFVVCFFFFSHVRDGSVNEQSQIQAN